MVHSNLFASYLARIRLEDWPSPRLATAIHFRRKSNWDPEDRNNWGTTERPFCTICRARIHVSERNPILEGILFLNGSHPDL